MHGGSNHNDKSYILYDLLHFNIYLCIYYSNTSQTLACIRITWGGSLKLRLLGSTSRVSELGKLGMGPNNLHLNMFPGSTEATGSSQHFKNLCILL